MPRIAPFWLFVLLLLPLTSQAIPDQTQLSVWANEAIVATYSYDHKNYLNQQRAIAKYFSAQGWTQYSAALNASGLPEAVQKNAYFVSAVALSPPTVKAISDQQWQAVMPLLVVYKNPQYEQKQTLEVNITFSQAPSGQGIRGLAINTLQAKIKKPACRCDMEEEASSASDSPQSLNGVQ
ncbi:DotI/IcmL family type IV secretion protein [Legionella taurinensis]|uniref:Type IV secretion protein IcmL n=1 Tax=Legionella taurinensis TaxID=70611 RepID=A0A3A5L1V5_9GAMM|nr:DotI/IcmL family type IV secretion protein [Legionella taurinensis]RJT44700.1 type IV secretion protein IcmL [Legionella taurinensis]RJT68733.1 type IV secretion protein IcmL [Legionella taurinensis]STY24804.1 IcmL/DotI homolog [Legionella taurinensis]